MRVLISALPSLGHVHPALGIARALRDAGHEVRLATAATMAPHIRAAGVEPVTMGYDLLRPGERLTPALAKQIGRELIESFDAWVEDLYQHTKSWSPDILMHDWSEAAGMLVAQRTGVPQVVLGVAVRPPTEYISHSRCWLGVDFDSLGGEAGVYGDLLLNLYPPSFTWPDTPRLAHEHYVRPSLYDGGEGQTPPEWLNELGDAPLVYVTMGTYYSRMPGFFERILEAAAGLDAQIIATVGKARNPAEFQPLPPNVRVEQYVPQSLLIPRCAAVICSGTFNTAMAALSYGVPLGNMSVTWDARTAPGSAERCAQLGVGISHPIQDETDEAGSLAAQLDPARINAMMRTLLEDSSYRRAAERLQAEIATLPDARAAVQLVESVVA